LAEWHEIFPNVSSVVALVDRLTHQADIIHIEEESYRLKESRERAEKGVTRRADKKRTKKAI
jgi:DNA replication protein DnaC